jgi:iron(III) transport system permease protein
MDKTRRSKTINLKTLRESARVPTLLYHFLVILIIYGTITPVLMVIMYGIGSDGNQTNTYYISRALSYLKNSLMLSLPVTLIATCFATILSITLWRLDFKGRQFGRIMAFAPLLNPPFVGSISFIMLFGKRGLITHELLGLTVSPFGYWGVFVMQVIGLTTLGYLFISTGVQSMQTIYEEAARTSGASEFYILRTVTLPVLKPEILGGMLLIFLASMADFGTPLIIGGPFQTLSSDLYIQITGLYDMKGASIAGAFLLLPCLIAFVGQRKIVKMRKYISKDLQKYGLIYPKVHPLVRFLLISFCLLFQGVIVLKYGFIIIGAFTRNWGHDYTFTLQHFVAVLNKEWAPFGNSIKLSLGVAFMSALLGIITAYLVHHGKRRGVKWLEMMGTLPAAVPGILFGIGYLVTFKYPLFGIGRGFWLSGPKLVLLGTGGIIYIICIFRYMNVGLRAGLNVLEHQDPSIEDAAHTLGASKLRTLYTVSGPLLLPGFRIAFVKNFTSTMTTLGAIIFLLLPSNKVAVQQIFQIITSSEIGIAAAMSLSLSLLMGVMLLLFHGIIKRKKLFERLRGEKNENRV